MWARIVEFMLALWLALSPFIFCHPSHEPFLWKNDLICAFLVGLFALLSFWHPLRRIHLLTIGVALWLWALAYTTFPQKAPIPQQNGLVIGLILFMLAIVPSHSSQLSSSWQKYIEENR